MRDVLPEIEARMAADFPDQLRDWRALEAAHKAQIGIWRQDVRTAQRGGRAPPPPPSAGTSPEPQLPRLRQNDVTIEKVSTLLAQAAPKGLLIVRDEFVGWLAGMNVYHEAGRAFWIELYGGRPYRVERQSNPEPIVIPRLAVAVTGGTQPERLATLLRAADDGLLSRLCWFWPDPMPFLLGREAPAAAEAIDAFDRLRLLDLAQGDDAKAERRPVMVALVSEALPRMQKFSRDKSGRMLRAD